jgi:hypothetical protein
LLEPTGNIKVTFSDGHSELLTDQGNCLSSRILSPGLVGWIELDKADLALEAESRRAKGALIVRLLDGSRKTFLTNPAAPFIENWGFSADGTTVAIQSSGHHGPRFYIEYYIETGEKKEEIVRNAANEKLPLWARHISYEEPTE